MMKVARLIATFSSLLVLSEASRRHDQYANDPHTRSATDRHSGCAHEILRRRLKRGYWQAIPTIATPAIIFQPIISSEYPASQPYFIPVWAANARVPLYYPVPGYLDDPRKSYLPPHEYLPARPDVGNTVSSTTTEKSSDKDEEQPVFIGNRMKEEDEDDAPIWGVVPSITTQRPAVPTRRTMKTTTFPPLVHQNRPGNSLSNNRPAVVDTPSQIFFERPEGVVQARPNSGGRPNINRQLSVNRTMSVNRVPRPGNANRNGNQNPVASPPLPTQAARQQPSRCVWAIISCCTVSSKNVSYSCFEQLGCTGAFWDDSPCDSEFARAAIAAAASYFNTK